MINTRMTGTVRMAGDDAGGVTVRIHLEDETLTLLAAGGAEIGTWPLSEVEVSPQPDGFHLRIEGEEVILTTDDDVRFALALGVATPASRLARVMARLREEAPAESVEVDELEDVKAIEDVGAPLPPRKESRSGTGLRYLGPLVVAAATIGFLTSVLAMVRGSAISFPGDIPAWPAMMASSFVLAGGGIAAFQSQTRGRFAIGLGTALGLVVILLTAGRIVDVGLVGEALLAFTVAIVTCGVLLAVDTAGRSAD
mgnify:FL=1